jgi:hypothetical protein
VTLKVGLCWEMLGKMRCRGHGKGTVDLSEFVPGEKRA